MKAQNFALTYRGLRLLLRRYVTAVPYGHYKLTGNLKSLFPTPYKLSIPIIQSSQNPAMTIGHSIQMSGIQGLHSPKKAWIVKILANFCNAKMTPPNKMAERDVNPTDGSLQPLLGHLTSLSISVRQANGSVYTALVWADNHCYQSSDSYENRRRTFES